MYILNKIIGIIIPNGFCKMGKVERIIERKKWNMNPSQQLKKKIKTFFGFVIFQP
jgi:hypothetical protein